MLALFGPLPIIVGSVKPSAPARRMAASASAATSRSLTPGASASTTAPMPAAAMR